MLVATPLSLHSLTGERSAAGRAGRVGDLKLAGRFVEVEGPRRSGHDLRIGLREKVEVLLLDVLPGGGPAGIDHDRLDSRTGRRGVPALAVVPVLPGDQVLIRLLDV